MDILLFDTNIFTYHDKAAQNGADRVNDMGGNRNTLAGLRVELGIVQRDGRSIDQNGREDAGKCRGELRNGESDAIARSSSAEFRSIRHQELTSRHQQPRQACLHDQSKEAARRPSDEHTVDGRIVGMAR